MLPRERPSFPLSRRSWRHVRRSVAPASGVVPSVAWCRRRFRPVALRLAAEPRPELAPQRQVATRMANGCHCGNMGGPKRGEIPRKAMQIASIASARSKWPDEECDLTPWVVSNLDKLGTQIGLHLHLIGMEVPVG